MKTIILISALILSFFLASYKETTSRAVLKSNKILCCIAEKLKENSTFKLSPVSDIIVDVLIYYGILCTGYDDFSSVMNILRKNTSNALGADKIYDMLRDINVAVISNIEEKCENILKFANSNQEKAYEAHKKCKNTVFYVYPGITAIIAIIFI